MHAQSDRACAQAGRHVIARWQRAAEWSRGRRRADDARRCVHLRHDELQRDVARVVHRDAWADATVVARGLWLGLAVGDRAHRILRCLRAEAVTAIETRERRRRCAGDSRG